MSQTRFPRLTFRRTLPVFLLAATLALAGCESAEEKAERYYKSGMELLAAGDSERAQIEFRNVFKYNGFHKEARATYADLRLKSGDTTEAYSQYLLLVEQYPDTVEVRQILAEIAISRGDWEEVERHGRAAAELAPDDARSKMLITTLAYREAVLDNDATARATIAGEARTLLESLPDNQIGRRIVIDSLINGPNPLDALPEIDKVLTLAPEDMEFHMQKFRLLAQAGDIAATGVQLRKMFEIFPESTEVRQALIAWYLVQKDIDGAEGFLRQIAGALDSDPEGHIAVVQLLEAARGADAARAELDRLIAANTGQPNADLYRAMQATIDFQQGKTTEAIASFEDVLKTAAPSDQTRRIKAMLAQFLNQTGNKVGARARIEEVLAEDATNIEALKLRAGWLIEEDKPGEAIIDLRTALSQNPRDAGTLTLMAQAHERDGSPELAGERLAMAVEVSGSGAGESLRYAQFLLRDGRMAAAEAVLNDARRVNPADIDILRLLAEIFLNADDFPRATEVITTIGALGTPQAVQVTQALQASMLAKQNRTDESLATLQDLIDQGDANTATVALMVQTQVRAGQTAEARSVLDAALAKSPDDFGLRLLSANLFGITGEADQSETVLRALIADHPTQDKPVQLLYSLLNAAGKTDEATAVLDAALAAQPESGLLRWIKAGALEQSGDIDGAIALYEALYAADSSNTVIANNLASLITTHRPDPANQERAFVIARRLRGLDVPAFQDTYGWIEFQRGNLTEALANLEPAAKGLPNDALVQFHLGMTYAGLDRRDEAIATLTRALEIAGQSPLPQFQVARDTLATLQAAPTPAAPAPAP